MKLKISNITPDNRLLLDDILDFSDLNYVYYLENNTVAMACGRPLVHECSAMVHKFHVTLEGLVNNNFKVEVLKH